MGPCTGVSKIQLVLSEGRTRTISGRVDGKRALAIQEKAQEGFDLYPAETGDPQPCGGMWGVSRAKE